MTFACPDCQRERDVGRAMAWKIRTGRVTGLCHPCSQTRIRERTATRVAKRCGSCKETFPLDAFNLSRRHTDGRSSRCRPCDRLAARAYYAENRSRAIESAARWAAENPERRRAIAREHVRRFRRAHPERARIRKDRTDFDAILQEHGLVCHICGGSIEPGDLHFDHVIPLSRGGAHDRTNIRPSHAKCNLRKGTRLLEEMAA